MARALWSGAIRFGLVNVPVRLFGAIREQKVQFHQLHDKDGGRIRYKRVCATDGEEVPYEHIIKGYEIARGQYVKIDPEELEALSPSGPHGIELEQFVKLGEIDPLHWDASYHVVPDRGGARAYALLVKAMEEAGRVGLGRIVLRTKSSLCALRPANGVLLLSTMHYADELVGTDTLDLPETDRAPTKRELEMAQQLVDSLTAPWKPEAWKDDYREKVLELVERKAEGEEVVTPAAEAPARVIDLMDALRRSLDQKKEAAEPAPEKKAARSRRRPTGETKKGRRSS